MSKLRQYEITLMRNFDQHSAWSAWNSSRLLVQLSVALLLIYRSLFTNLWLVCQQLCAKASGRMCMKFSRKVGNGPMNKWLNFGGDPDHGSGNGFGYGSRSVSRHW